MGYRPGRFDAGVAHSAGDIGFGAHVAILDTGIDADHPDLQANLGDGYAVETCRSGCSTAWDDNDHGTHCAGIAGTVDNIAAPGTYIYSTIVDGYQYYSGTSMACPHVAAAGGQLMANCYSNTEARTRLRETAEDLGLPSSDQGNGLLDGRIVRRQRSGQARLTRGDNRELVGRRRRR